jgi:excisionase family DNA binding protein
VSVLTLQEAADHLRVTPTTLRREITRGKLSAFRVGRHFRVSEEDLNRYVRNSRVKVAGRLELVR